MLTFTDDKIELVCPLYIPLLLDDCIEVFLEPSIVEKVDPKIPSPSPT
jgi:hypothetical protein